VLDIGCLPFVDAKTEHCHTYSLCCMTPSFNPCLAAGAVP
jgi:hypothetical protein